MNDHFDREHLKEMSKLEKGGLIGCEHPRCKDEDLKLTSLDHFRAYVAQVQGVLLRPSHRQKQRV